MSDDLVAFLAARLDEDEAAAKAAVDFDYGVKDWDADGSPVNIHIGRHDPARVLRQVAVSRKILADFKRQSGYDLPDGVRDGRDPDEREADQLIKDALEIVVLDLADIYSDHPDYRQEWP